MTGDPRAIAAFLASRHPYDGLPGDLLTRVAAAVTPVLFEPGQRLYQAGAMLDGLFVIADGRVEIRDPAGDLVSLLGPGNSFGERGLLKDGIAVTTAIAEGPGLAYVIPKPVFLDLIRDQPAVARFFDRGARQEARPLDLSRMPITDLMTKTPLSCPATATVREAAVLMRDRGVSCLLVIGPENVLEGILTTGDLTARVIAAGLDLASPVSQVMTRSPAALGPDALGIDVLHEMAERGIGHLPIVERGEGDVARPVGIVTQTDLTRRQAASSERLIREVASARDVVTMAAVVGQIPELLAQLVGAGHPHEIVCRLITDIADAVTRRLLSLAEAALGPPPVPYLWLACGSQGRQEQTGVSDQDNCLFLDDRFDPGLHDEYFLALARSVSDGLHTCGYVYCPGDMMATNGRWRQPVRVWRQYFRGWVQKPDPMAQMLASVMFDLRPIGGEARLLADVQAATLEMAAKNSIFLAHMVSNSLKHTPPLGLIRGFATIRSGDHKNTVDLKHNGVVPVVDLGRVYALQGRIVPVNTRARLTRAVELGVVSPSGGRTLLDAYDLIARTRLEHQAARIRDGRKPDNFMEPAMLSDLQRSHLRDAFVVVKTMQASLAQGRSAAL